MIVINSSTRQFNIPGADMTFGVEADAGSERKYFQCPRYVGNKLDIASSFVRINYRNANGEIDSYLVEDLTVDGENVLFSWELSPKVTAYKGQLRFVMCVVGPDTKVAWHTTLGTGIVLEGLEPDYAMIQAGTADVVAQLIAMTEKQTAAVENKGAEWVRNVQSEGTDQIIAVQTAGRESREAAVAEIEAKGVNTRESIPEDYTALSEAVDTLNRTRGAAIVCEASGETVVVGDSSNLPMQGLRVFGKTTQESTTGAQLTPYPYFNGNKTYNGITWTINPDGSVKAKGIATATSPLYFTNSTHELAPGQYTVSGSANGVTVRIDSTIQETGKWKAGVAISKNGQPVTFTVTEEDAATYFYTLYASVENGNTVDVTIYPMLNAGSSALPWEIYTGGKPSPSPEYPQELVSLEPVVRVCGKNLFKTEFEPGYTETVRGVTFTVNPDRSIHVTGTPTAAIAYNIFEGEVFPIGNYFVSGAPATASQKFRLQVNLTVNGTEKTGGVDMGGGSKLSVDASVSSLRGYIYVASDAGAVDGTFYPQIETGSVATEYEPYSGQTVEITHTLPGIPVASGGNYTDSDGQQWVCDEVDLERGVYVQRIENTTVNLTSSGTLAAGYVYGVFGTSASKVSVVNFGSIAEKAKRVTSYGERLPGCFYENDKNIVFIGDTEDTLLTLQEKYNGSKILYVLANPIETALSETEIAAYRALHSNYPNTTVLNDSGAHMVVKYAADTKLYIDNKITALVGG